MTQQLLKSRLLVSAQCAPEQMQPDFETQLEEFKAIVHSGHLDIWGDKLSA